MTDVVDDTVKLLRELAQNTNYDNIDMLLEAARRCDAVADFVKAVESKCDVREEAWNLYNKLKQTS